MSNKKEKKRRKRTARVICQNRMEFWTTQKQFWQWIRDGVVIKTQDSPLTGMFCRENEELAVVLSNTVLNLAYPIHLSEAMRSRRLCMSS
jgi:hypothetical protein